VPNPIYRPEPIVRADLEAIFPNLSSAEWYPKSPFDTRYQCIALAACENQRKWWPIDSPPECYWPLDTFDDGVDSFIAAFATLGYETCLSASFEFGYQKVAIYTTATGIVRHMARQHVFGKGWLSKIGDCEDIFHKELSAIETDPSPYMSGYGEVRQILKRSWLRALLVIARQRIIMWIER
jgi:hypothetical protein